MQTFQESASGKLARFTLACGILAVGFVAMAGPEYGLYVIAGAPPLLIVGSLFAVGLAIAKHPMAAMVLVLALPLIAGPYLGLLYVARSFGSVGGLAIACLGAAILAGMLNPVLAIPRREALSR